MEEKKCTALVFGATGLTGHFVTEHLLADKRYDNIKLFVREEFNFPFGKVKQIVFNSANVEAIEKEISGDHLYCCLGSTIKKAGSREEFYNIDHNLVERIAKIAASNRVKSFVVISSVGANDKSGNFYLKTKGEMEESIKTFTFCNLSIVRPSMLLGIRHEKRMMEEVTKTIAKLVGRFMVGKLKKYKPIHASIVAKAMIELANKPKGMHIVESDKLEQLATN